ncbi:MAG: aquaporin Z [Myxococcaceae bacterium]
MAAEQVSDVRRYGAELLGTFVLVLGGVGTAVIAGEQVGALGIAFAFGLSLLAMVYAIGPISGCHVNPAVTLGVLLAGRMKARHAFGYVVAQIAGATLAALLVLVIAKGIEGGYSAGEAGLGANGFGAHSPNGYAMGSAFLAEVALTFLLVFTVLAVTDPRAPVGFAGLAIGLVLTLIHLVGIPITNTSVNPARSIGPALFVGGWALGQLWLFIVAPLLGGAVAAAVYRTLRIPAEAEEATRRQRAERMRAVERPS